MNVIEASFNKMLCRPVIVVSTISSNGVSNAAPFSFNSPATTKPPTYGFCCEVEHDTWRNIQDNKEFVVNLVDDSFGPKMASLAKDLPYGVSEIIETGLTEEPSKLVKPPRIKEAYGWIECRMVSYAELSSHVVWIFGEILVSEIREDVYNMVVDVDKIKLLHHIWGKDYVITGLSQKYER
jgi:flavin reductase (DIM6/NTAB) family NADH-FMN oxidoreductase RutF